MLPSFQNEKNITPSQLIQTRFHENIDEYVNSYSLFFQGCENLKTKKDLPSLKDQFAKTIIAYKKLEYLLDYLSPQYVKDFVNGPPLPKLARNMAGVIEEEPTSMQVVEEILYSDDVINNKTKLIKESKKIMESFAELEFVKHQQITEMHVLEGIKLELLRVMAMGITGFDTPASNASISNSLVAFKELAWSYETLSSRYPKYDSLHKKTIFIFKESIKQLSDNPDFDTFDRAKFVKECIVPLYQHINVFHNISGIEHGEEVSGFASALSNESKIFDNRFFNPVFFNPYLKYSTNKKELVNLGKLLFFDPALSLNMKRSCNSCHLPNKGFTDGLAKSVSMDFIGTVDRNAPTIINAVHSTRQFWDMRANDLSTQAEHVIFNEKEFHSNYDTIFNRISKSEEYVLRFQKAFPEHKGKIMKETFSKALAAYVGSLTAYNSDFDKYLRGEKVAISKRAIEGFNLFMGKAGCGTCHFAPTFNGLVPPFFSDTEAEVVGVPKNKDSKEIDSDVGRFGGQMKERADIYLHAFKTPTVRNVALTAPFMHNGAYKNLKDVLEFYNNGGGAGIGIKVPNQTLPSDSLHLNKQEMKAIVAFMNTLTDTTGITSVPKSLPKLGNKLYDNRKVGGEY